jgi:hypothetical protein
MFVDLETKQRTASPPLEFALIGGGSKLRLLLAAVVGSGMMGQRLSEGNVAIALLANSRDIG